MASTWDQMSKDERQSSGLTKKEYNRDNGFGKQGELEAKRSEAAERAQTHTNSQESAPAQSGQQSQNSQALNNQHTPKANDVGGGAKPAAPTNNPSAAFEAKQAYKAKQASGFQQASAYLAQGNSRDAEFERILKDSGGSNHSFNQYSKSKKKEAYDANRSGGFFQGGSKMSEAQVAFNKAKENAGVGQVGSQFTVNQQSYYQDQFDKTGRYHNDSRRNEAIEGLMGTGMKFATMDIERELGGASNHQSGGLYVGHTGGATNALDYAQNYSVLSGNFTGFKDQSEYQEKSEVIDQRNNQMQTNNNFFNDADMNQKYGQYDWFKEQKQAANKTFANQYLG